MTDLTPDKLQRYMVPSGAGIKPHPFGLLYHRDDVLPLIQAISAERDTARDAALDAAAEVASSPDTPIFDDRWTEGQCAAAISAMIKVAAAIRAMKGGAE